VRDYQVGQDLVNLATTAKRIAAATTNARQKGETKGIRRQK